MGGVRGEIDVGQQCGEEEPASEPFVDQHRVLAEPAEACSAGEVAFEKRRSVDDAASAAAGPGVMEDSGEFLEPGPQDIVVVRGNSRIAGDAAFARLKLRFFAAVVVHGEHDHAADFAEHGLGVVVGLSATFEVVHLAGKAGVEPFPEFGGRRGANGRSDSD